MQNQPNKTMNNDLDAPRPDRSLYSARSGLLILLSVFGYFTAAQLYVPAEPLSAAPQTGAIPSGKITLELPQFGPAQQGVAQEAARSNLQIPSSASENKSNAEASDNSPMQIIPRNPGSRSVPSKVREIEPQELLPFSPRRRRETRHSGHVSLDGYPLPNAETVSLQSQTQSLQIPVPEETSRARLSNQSAARSNDNLFVLPNTTRRLAQQNQNSIEAAPATVDEIPLPAPDPSDRLKTNGESRPTESVVPGRQTDKKDWDTWSVPPSLPEQTAGVSSDTTSRLSQAPVATDGFDGGVQPQADTRGADSAVEEVKIPVGSWSVMPDQSLLEANRVMEESFLRSMGQIGPATAMEPPAAYPHSGETGRAANSDTPQPSSVPMTGFGQQNSGSYAGSDLLRPLPLPAPATMAPQPMQQQQSTPQQQAAQQKQTPQENWGGSTPESAAAELVIPGFSSQPPVMQSQPPAVFTPVPQDPAFEAFPLPENVPSTVVTPTPQQSNTPPQDQALQYPSSGIPRGTPVPADQPPVLAPGFQQSPAPYDAPVFQDQQPNIQIQPSVVLPQQGGHSFPDQVPVTEQHSPSIVTGGYGQGSYPGTSGYRATGESDAPAWMSPYQQRASVADAGSIISSVRSLPPLPPGFSPWWDVSVRQSTGPDGTSVSVDVGNLLQDALLYSPQVNAIKAEPEVQYRVITQEAAKFDWTAFLETTYDDLNDPVGNTLTTATGEDRLLIRKFRGSGGVRRKNLHGGEFQIAQDIGHENQTSSFFIPNNQGTSRLEISYRQPLLDGAGEAYNRSEIILASIAANGSEDEVVGALQEHLIEVTEAYWALYRARAEFFQRQKLLSSANNVLVRLEGRSGVDTIPRQVLRSRAAVARAQTRIQRTLARVEDAESQLRLLVNSPSMLTGGPIEVLPLEAPNMVTENADLQSVLQTALANRPDISEAIRKMRASTVRLGVSKRELLPRLDFLVESYVSDLAGSSDVAQSFRGQFTDNRPGYTVGFELEIPLENRAAIAKHEQRQWELKRSMNVFRATVEKSLTDTEVARREVATAYSEIVSRYHSMMAAEQESRYLADRFTVLPASEDSATLLLEDLLDSFERLADEESSFVQAQVDHAIALVRLKEEMGVLLKSRNSRPDVEQSEQAYMSDRLQASSSRSNAKGPTSSIAAPTATVSSATRPAGAGRNTRVEGHQLGQPPVAGYTTTWKRPEAKKASQSRIVPVSGYSQ